MPLVRVHNFSVSLDGFGTGEGLTVDQPFGHAGERLHEWMFDTRFGRAHFGDRTGGSDGIDQAFALRTEQGKLEDILNSPASLRRTVIKEIEADAKQYGDERRTLIQADKRAVAEVRVVDEPVTVVVSLKGWVRSMKGHEVDPASLQFKAGDALYGSFPCRSIDNLLVFGSNGRVYSTAVSLLPGGRGDGQPITTLIDLESGTQPAHYLAGAASR